MILRDFHTHTTFSDGKSTPEEMVISAIEKGLKSIGFSDHSYTDFDESYCMKRDNTEYLNTIAALKEKYAEKIKICCGIEQDFYSNAKTDGYDYIIGSVHYIKIGKNYIPIDEGAEAFKATAEKYFGGDYIRFAEEYFNTVANVVEKTGADIIGHLDLITKFNAESLFDETDTRYIAAWKSAVDKLLSYNKPFEINTGAISRGYKSFPYPAQNIIDYISQNGGSLILSSDAHSADGIAFQFDKWAYLSGTNTDISFNG